MSLLSKLKVVAAPVRASSPITIRRSKLVKALVEQKAMAESKLSGADYSRSKTAWHTDTNGNRVKVQRTARVRQWWSGPDLAVVLVLRYGSRPLAIQKGMSGIDAGSIQNLPKVIDTIIEAVEAGELDAQLAAASDRNGKVSPKKAA